MLLTTIGCTCTQYQGKVYSNCYVGIDACPNADLPIATSANYTVVLTQPVWDDMQISMANAKVPAVNAPTWRDYKQSQVPAFSASQVNVLYFTAQLPHSYKEGSDIEFHIHIAYPDNGAGNSRWYLSYSWANTEDNFPVASVVTTTIASPVTTDRHQMAIIAPVILGTGKTVSSVLICSIQRLGNTAEDTYGSEIYLVSGDFHFQKDTIGSRYQATK
jgi:hypothetical protein